MISGFLKSIMGYVAFGVMVSLVLVLLRFAGPDIGFCRVQYRGAAQEVICLKVLKFKGNDFWSVFRLSVYTGDAFDSRNGRWK
jgi:hypothetical protein